MSLCLAEVGNGEYVAGPVCILVGFFSIIAWLPEYDMKINYFNTLSHIVLLISCIIGP